MNDVVKYVKYLFKHSFKKAKYRLCLYKMPKKQFFLSHIRSMINCTRCALALVSSGTNRLAERIYIAKALCAVQKR